jgi:hypothetical protein
MSPRAVASLLPQSAAHRSMALCYYAACTSHPSTNGLASAADYLLFSWSTYTASHATVFRISICEPFIPEPDSHRCQMTLLPCFFLSASGPIVSAVSMSW